MRIAIVTTYPPGTGSLNEYAGHFVKALRQKPEIDETILLVDELPHGQQYPVEPATTIVPCWKFGAFDNARRIVAAVRRAKPDVVLFNIQFASFGSGKIAASLGLLTPSLVKRAGFPTIVLLHNIMETVDLKGAGFGGNRAMEWATRTAGEKMTRRLLAVDFVAVTIPTYVEILEQKYAATNVVLAPHGAFDDSPMPTFEQDDGPLQIMAFGKFGTYKRVDVLIDAYRILHDEGGRSLELVIAGTNSPNAPGYLERMAQRAADLPNVHFTGYVPEEDVPKVFQSADVVVFPYSSTTGSSGVLHQAGDYAKAVVLPDLGDLAHLIMEEGFTGEFFAPEDPVSLATAIARLLDHPEARHEMGRQNFLAARGLPIQDVVDWYLVHIQELLTPKKRRTGSVALAGTQPNAWGP